MGFLGLLKFALFCIDLLAWPVIALGYPLFASIRAIETGSKYHLKKLAIYWTLFSLISLFEFVFVKLIEWIPFWSSIKLASILCLVIPRFHGACYAYQSFIRPYLIVNVQEAIRMFEAQKSHTSEAFLDVADKYMKENGVEALEKLIAAKTEQKEPGDTQRSSQFQEGGEQKPKEADGAEKDKGILEAVTEETTYAAVLDTETMLPPETTTDQNKQPMKKAQPGSSGWSCHLCQVSMTGEKNMNDHLKGKKHTSMIESLKSSKLSNTTQGHSRPGSSSSREGSPKQDSQETPKKTAQNQPKQPVKKPNVDGQHNLKLLCSLCGVKLYSDVNLAAHLKGKKHVANLEKLMAKV